MRRLRCLGLGILLLGCTETSAPTPPPPEFAVFPAQQWAGGTILVRSQFFDGLDSLPTVTAAGIEMTALRVDDSTVSATLPSFSSRAAAIEVLDGGASYLIDTVQVVGFRSLAKSSPQVAFWPVILESVNGPLAVSGTWPMTGTGSLGLIDLRTATTTELMGVAPLNQGSGQGPGTSYRPDHLILKDSTGVMAEFRVLPTIAQADTTPAVNAFPRNMARLSESVWLEMGKHYTSVWRNGAIVFSLPIEQAYLTHLSLAADRAVLSSYTGGIVFEMSTGDTLYRLPMTSVTGAAFSPDGAMLYATSGYLSGTNKLAAVNALTGAVIAEATFAEDVRPQMLALNADGTRIYLNFFTGNAAGQAPTVIVLDATSLMMVGRLSADPDVDCTYFGYDDAIAVDDPTSTIFIVESHSAASNCIWAFDMLP